MAHRNGAELCVILSRVCDTKDRLLGEYDATAKHFSKAVEDLTKLSSTTSVDKYLELRNAAEQWRMATEAAQKRVMDHASSHKC